MIKYVTGDATRPIGDGPKLIIHIVNDVGAWGAGFVMALSKRWKDPEKAYREWAAGKKTALGHPFVLGHVQYVHVEPGLSCVIVANMLAQHGFGTKAEPPIRYDALEDALTRVALYCAHWNISVHAPRIGAGIAGGDWNIIEALLERILAEQGTPVTIYDLPRAGSR
jgi:O-acetyl-ADP-ribose deacetylase (regulator of RNase III)